MIIESIRAIDNTPNHYEAVVDGVKITVATRPGQTPEEVLQEAFGPQTLSCQERRRAEYPPLQEQLDMMFHDPQKWRDTIAAIKARHPK